MYFLSLSMPLWIPDAVLQPNTHRSSTFCNTSSIACAPANKSHFIALNKHNEYDQSLIFVCKQYNADIPIQFYLYNEKPYMLYSAYNSNQTHDIWTLRGLPCLFWVSLSSKCSDLPLLTEFQTPSQHIFGSTLPRSQLIGPFHFQGRCHTFRRRSTRYFQITGQGLAWISMHWFNFLWNMTVGKPFFLALSHECQNPARWQWPLNIDQKSLWE